MCCTLILCGDAKVIYVLLHQVYQKLIRKSRSCAGDKNNDGTFFRYSIVICHKLILFMSFSHFPFFLLVQANLLNPSIQTRQLCRIVDPRANGGKLARGKRIKSYAKRPAGVPLISPVDHFLWRFQRQFVPSRTAPFVRMLPTKTTREGPGHGFGVLPLRPFLFARRVREATFPVQNSH
jgi:hypothetical protein